MNELIIVPKTLKWFHYRQNNSGGYFITNDQVSEDVFVQAHTAEEAEGIIWPILEEYDEYCDCCGERWASRVGWNGRADEGYDTPSEYGTSIFENYSPFGRDSYATLYYFNGLVDKFYPFTKNVESVKGDTF